MNPSARPHRSNYLSRNTSGPRYESAGDNAKAGRRSGNRKPAQNRPRSNSVFSRAPQLLMRGMPASPIDGYSSAARPSFVAGYGGHHGDVTIHSRRNEHGGLLREGDETVHWDGKLIDVVDSYEELDSPFVDDVPHCPSCQCNQRSNFTQWPSSDESFRNASYNLASQSPSPERNTCRASAAKTFTEDSEAPSELQRRFEDFDSQPGTCARNAVPSSTSKSAENFGVQPDARARDGVASPTSKSAERNVVSFGSRRSSLHSTLQRPTVIHLAAKGGHDSVVRTLLQRKGYVDIDAQDNNGATALHIAASLCHEAVAKVLVEGKANINLRDRKGNTPLQEAARDMISLYDSWLNKARWSIR